MGYQGRSPCLVSAHSDRRSKREKLSETIDNRSDEQGSSDRNIWPASSVISSRLGPNFIRHEINQQYVRIFYQSVEHNPLTVGGDVKGPHDRGTAEPRQAL
jgi:hypothetical protein